MLLPKNVNKMNALGFAGNEHQLQIILVTNGRGPMAVMAICILTGGKMKPFCNASIG